MTDLPAFRRLLPGDPAPWFYQRSPSNPRYAFNAAAGRYIVLFFFGSAGDAASAAALRSIASHRGLFDDTRASFFGVSLDPNDEQLGRIADSPPGLRFFFDFDGTISRSYGSIPFDATHGSSTTCLRFWLVLDPTMRIIHRVEFKLDGSDAAEVLRFVTALPPPDHFAGTLLQAPILFLLNIFEAEFCQTLVSLYDAAGGKESGFMRQIGDRTQEITDFQHKRRKDHRIEDRAVIQQAQARIQRRIVPEIAKIHQFHVTRMERSIVACYAAEDGGHFRAHRDNTTSGTAHRRFAVSINLNDDFDGGEISFPEYGPRSYKPPVGAAVVFSCSLLHAVSRVTRGRRYAFLPFLYDEAASVIREANRSLVDQAGD